jgi:hypothetical protein
MPSNTHYTCSLDHTPKLKVNSTLGGGMSCDVDPGLHEQVQADRFPESGTKPTWDSA